MKFFYFLILIIFNFLLCFNAYSDGSMCISKGLNTQAENLDKLLSTSESIVQQAQILHAQSNMGDFCQRNLILRYLNSIQKAPMNCSTLPMSELEKLADDARSSGHFYNDWEKALISTKKTRLEIVTGKDDLEISSDKKVEISETKRNLEHNFNEVANKVSTSTIDSKLLIYCGIESLSSIFTCKKALNFIEQNASPKGMLRLMIPDAWKLIYETDKFNEGIEKVARKLQKEIKDHSSSRTSNIWDDLANSFKSSGLSTTEAEEGVWAILAIISNGGQNTKTRVGEIESSNKSDELSFIAKAMSALDYLKQKNGLPLYSYPSNIKTFCDSAKPYHFWMSAYLARELVKKNIVGVDDAIKYSFLAEKGYQLNRNLLSSWGSGKVTNALSAEPYGPIHDVIRMDLANAAAGAIFGAKSAKNKSNEEINLDVSIISLLKKSNPHASLPNSGTLSELNTYMQFNNVFVPDTALDSLWSPDK